MGASAGGIEALAAVLSAFPAQCPATLIVQHIPARFVPGLARRLDRLSAGRVCEAVDGAVLDAGQIFIAPADRHLEVRASPGGYRCRLRDGAPVNGFKPSVDVLFSSLASCAGAHAIGVILSGMGHDGVDGLLKMRRAGAHTFAQDGSTCTVYGMPKAAFEAGAVEEQMHLDDIAPAVLSVCGFKGRELCP